MNSYAPPLKGTADNLAQYGRYGDSMLVHMNPIEVQGIASLVPGGRLPVNPVTGQPEAFAFLVPMLGGLLGKAALGSAIGPALAGALGSGVATAIAEKDLGKGLAAGIMGFGLGKVLGAGQDAFTGASEATTGLAETGEAISGMGFDPAATPEAMAGWDTSKLTTSQVGDLSKLLGQKTGYEQTLAAAPGGLEAMGQAVMEPTAILPIGVGGAELARLEREEELEDFYAAEDAEREGKLTRSEEEADRARRRSIYDYGLPTSGILPRDPRYAAGGGLISLNPRDYAAKREGLSRLMGEPVRMQAGGTSRTSQSHSEMQSALRGPFKIAPSQMQQLYASGYRPGIDPELEYFRHEPFQGVMDPLDPNRAFVPTGDPSASQDSMTAAGSQIYDPATNIYGGEGPTGVPLGAGGSGFSYGDPMPRRGDYDEETGGIEHMKALRGWRAAQGYQQQPQRGTQELSKTMMLSLGQTPPDERGFVPRPGTGQTGTPPPVAPVTSYLPEAPVQSTYLSQRPRRSDYDEEGGASEYRSDLRDWNASQAQPAVVPPPPVMQPPAPPPPPLATAPPPMQTPITQPLPRQPLPQMPPMPPSPTISPPAPPPVQAFGFTEKPAMTIKELNALRPNRSDYDAEDKADYRYDLREWNELRKEVQGYQGGGITELVGGAPEAAMPVDPAMMGQAMTDPTAGIDPATIQLVEQTAMAVLGQVPQEQADAIIQAFIQQFGPEAFQMLRQQVLASVEPGAQTEGMIEGQGDGMSDEVMGMIGDQQRVAVSPGEYIVPADVVSGIGNGSSDAGAGELDRMMADIRQARTGMAEQPPAINPRGAMPV